MGKRLMGLILVLIISVFVVDSIRAFADDKTSAMEGIEIGADEYVAEMMKESSVYNVSDVAFELLDSGDFLGTLHDVDSEVKSTYFDGLIAKEKAEFAVYFKYALIERMISCENLTEREFEIDDELVLICTYIDEYRTFIDGFDLSIVDKSIRKEIENEVLATLQKADKGDVLQIETKLDTQEILNMFDNTEINAENYVYSLYNIQRPFRTESLYAVESMPAAGMSRAVSHTDAGKDATKKSGSIYFKFHGGSVADSHVKITLSKSTNPGYSTLESQSTTWNVSLSSVTNNHNIKLKTTSLSTKKDEENNYFIANVVISLTQPAYWRFDMDKSWSVEKAYKASSMRFSTRLYDITGNKGEITATRMVMGNTNVSRSLNIQANLSHYGIRTVDGYFSTGCGATIKLVQNKFTIQYAGNGNTGGSTATSSHTYGVDSSIRANGFTKTGYTFKNWYCASTGKYYEDKYYSVKELTSVNNAVVKFTAQWSPNTYSIVYDGNTNTGGYMESSSHTYDVKKELSANEFIKRGHTFSGWNTKADGTGTSYGDQASVMNLSSVDGGTVTLYAQWKPNTYTVKYDGNGNTGGSMSNSTFTYDQRTNLKANGYVKDGYRFIGWNTKADGTGTSYSDQASVMNLSSVNGGTVTLYAQWRQKYYTVKYDGNGNTSGSMSNSTFYFNQRVTLKANAYVKYGFGFSGWNTKSDGTGTSYSNQASIINLSSVDGGMVTLYAQWKPNTYTVKYDGNGNTGGSMSDSTFTYNRESNLKANGYIKDGFEFSGWNTKKDGTGVHYADQEAVKNLTSEQNGVVVLYAIWGNKPDIHAKDGSSFKCYEGEKVTKADLLAKVVAEDKEDGDLTPKIHITKIEYSAGKLKPDGTKTTEKEIIEWEEDMPDDYLLDTWYMQLDKEDKFVTHKISYSVMDSTGNSSVCELKVDVLYNEFPEINAKDYRFTIREAQEGKITYKALMEKARAWDLEDCSSHCPDGTADGDNCLDDDEACEFTKDNLKILGWDNDLFKVYSEGKHTKPGYEVLNYQVIDQYGKETIRQFVVYISDDGTLEAEPAKIVRFIDWENYQKNVGISDTLPEDDPSTETNERKEAMKAYNDNGGLYVDSFWYTKENYADMISSVLEAIDKGNAAAQEKWIFGYNDINRVKEYVKKNGIGNSSKADGLTGFLTEFDSNKVE